jgi:hypothetical protein
MAQQQVRELTMIAIIESYNIAAMLAQLDKRHRED